MPDHYDPNQKRILKGHEGGGRWTDEDFHLARVPLRPAPAHPRVMPPPPRVLPPLGPAEPWVTPPPSARPGLDPLTIEGLAQRLRDAEALYEQQSLHDTAEKRATATLQAREFRYGDATAVQVEVRDAEQVKAVCKGFDKVQRLVDEAEAKTAPTGPGFNEAQRGTAIHVYVAHKINGPVKRGELPQDVTFRAETSVVKTFEAMLQQTLRDKLVTDDYGKPGTIRYDVLEFVNHNTVCVYDIKTADALLSRRRMGHFAELLSRYGNKLIIVIQVKPSYMYRK
jgi:hypothetical protein